MKRYTCIQCGGKDFFISTDERAYECVNCGDVICSSLQIQKLLTNLMENLDEDSRRETARDLQTTG